MEEQNSKYDNWAENMAKRIDNGEKLSREEVEDLVFGDKEVYRECGENGKYRRPILSVISLLGKLYAVNWEEGLADYHNEFWNQPYEVELKERNVMVTETIVERKHWL